MMNGINTYCISNLFERRTQPNVSRNLVQQNDFTRNLTSSGNEEASENQCKHSDQRGEELKSQPTGETQARIFVNSNGEKVVAISGPFGTMYLKIGYVNDHSPDDGNSISDTSMGEITGTTDV